MFEATLATGYVTSMITIFGAPFPIMLILWITRQVLFK
jgi:hypothetical protein